MKDLSEHRKRQQRIMGWVQYMGMVLAFIGLWQLLSNGAIWLHHLF